MNIVFYSLIIFIACYLFLKFIANTSTKKISNLVRILTIILCFVLAGIFVFAGRFLFSLPLILLSLGIVKLKGLTIFQLIGLFRLIQTLKNSGRFTFSKNQTYRNSSSLTLDEAYKILNLDKNKKISIQDVNKAHAKIQKKIHPDISPETSRLSAIVNEAKDVILKNMPS